MAFLASLPAAVAVGAATPPVRAITRGPKFHWFAYYDKLQFDPSGRFVLANQVDFEHRSPKPDDVIEVGMIDCAIAGGLFVLQSYLATMVWPDFTTFSPVETAFLDVGGRAGGPALFYFLSFVLLVAGVASAVTGQASASRLLCGMGRDRLLPYRIFGYVHPRLGTPVHSVLLMGGIHLAGALILKFTEAAELVNFGAFIGFMSVNLCVIRYDWRRPAEKRQWLFHLATPALGFSVCFYIWLHLSRFALALGGLWLALGLFYLLFLTRGFKQTIADLKLSRSELRQ